MDKQEGKIYSGGVDIALIGRFGETNLLKEIEKGIAQMAEKYGGCLYRMTVYENIREALAYKRYYDLLFMYMENDNMDARSIEGLNWLKDVSFKSIWLAEDMTYVKDAFKAGAFRYILLADVRTELEEAMHDAWKEIRSLQGIGLTINGVSKWVLLKEIYYVEALGDEAIIYTKDTYAMVRMTMNHLLEQLGNSFYRCHKSYIVNLCHIEKIEEQDIVLGDGRAVPISVRQRRSLLHAYQLYVKVCRMLE